VPDAGRGQIVKAVVVVNAGFDAGEALARVLQDYVKGAVAAYKYPRLVEFAASLPRTSNGKLMRHALRGGASG